MNDSNSGHHLHDDFSSVFNNQSVDGNSLDVSDNFGQFQPDNGGGSSLETDKKVFSFTGDEGVGAGDMTRSQLRQLLEPAVATRPVLVSSSSSTSTVVAPPVMIVHGSTITPLKRVSFSNHGTHAPHFSFAAPGASCPTSSGGVPLSPGARSRAFFTPISPHGSQPSSAVHSPFISPRSTPTASLMRSRNNSGQPRSRHPSLKAAAVVVSESSDDVFLSPSSSTRAARSRHNSGNQVVQHQLALTGILKWSSSFVLCLKSISLD